MRDIKFKIWDKELKEFHIENLQDLCEDDYWYDGETGMYSVLYDCNNEQERFVALQFIGLHDKNEKEIYEGDIIDDGYNKGVVKYGRYNCTCCDGIYGWYINNEVDIRSVEKFCKVIGNIYENPELLKGADNTL